MSSKQKQLTSGNKHDLEALAVIKVLVSGAYGRMGQAVVKAVLEDNDLELVGAVDIAGDGDAGLLAGAGECGIALTKDLEATIDAAKPQVMVDFTRPDVVFGNACLAIKKKVAPVIGTTGLSDEQKQELSDLSAEYDTPVFIAPNFAIGAVLMMLMAKQAAKYMPEVEIIELHHDKKLDAPSGTALQTAAMISEVREAHQQGNPNESEKVTGARGANVDGMHIHSVRLPGYVAHQEVIFGGLGQTLSIRHDSLNRESFMPGVCLACKKVVDLKGMVIGLDKIMD